MHRALEIVLTSLLLAGSIAGSAAADLARIAPPRGVEIQPEVRRELEREVSALGARIAHLRCDSELIPSLGTLLPDVEIFHKAVTWGLIHDEFLRSNDVASARILLNYGRERADQLANGKAPWLSATGLVVRGFVSRIDGSIQPYGLVVPTSFAPGSNHIHRLDVWLHGRDNNLTEIKFLSDRLQSIGDFAPADTFVLHPYGRYCNAFKFAGETDVFEALEHAASHYPIDRSRLAIRGFSMGGAGTWHLAAHYGGFWAAAAPGAGFAETAEYTKALSREPRPSQFERTLWHLYDAKDYAANLFNLPTIAYSGERDQQKQAADIMARAMKAEGIELTHLVGPGVGHKYEPRTKQELARRFDALLQNESDQSPERVRLVTWSLRYNSNKWVTIDGMKTHWHRASVAAEIVRGNLQLTTTNVSQLTLAIPKTAFVGPNGTLHATVDGQPLPLRVANSTPRKVTLAHSSRHWKQLDSNSTDTPRKRHGLQGPIDDAFMDSFLVVVPTGQPMLPAAHQWAIAELTRFTNEWRAQFRGDVRLKSDVELTDNDIASYHLILFGDPQSHCFLAKIAASLPLHWDKNRVQIGNRIFPSGDCAPALIYPNPLNRSRYIVLNSGFTFWREGAASNAQQTPKLPDYAIIEVTGENRSPRQVRDAGFFGEKWEVAK